RNETPRSRYAKAAQLALRAWGWRCCFSSFRFRQFCALSRGNFLQEFPLEMRQQGLVSRPRTSEHLEASVGQRSTKAERWPWERRLNSPARINRRVRKRCRTAMATSDLAMLLRGHLS